MTALVALIGGKVLAWVVGIGVVLLGGVATGWGLRQSGVNAEKGSEAQARAKDDANALGADTGVELSDAELLRRLHTNYGRK